MVLVCVCCCCGCCVLVECGVVWVVVASAFLLALQLSPATASATRIATTIAFRVHCLCMCSIAIVALQCWQHPWCALRSILLIRACSIPCLCICGPSGVGQHSLLGLEVHLCICSHGQSYSIVGNVPGELCRKCSEFEDHVYNNSASIEDYGISSAQ